MSRTFIKILISISLLFFIVLLSFSITAFKSFENHVTNRAYEENIRELSIISDNIKNMHETVRSFTFQQIDDLSIQTLLAKEDIEFAEMYNYMDILKKKFTINPIFHSVVMYSGITGKFFSTLSTKAHLDEYFTDSIENHSQIQMLVPVLRELSIDVYNVSDTVFTYLYFETDSNDKVIKAMAVNLNAAWLLDNLRKLKGKTAEAYIVDIKNSVFIDRSNKLKSIEELDVSLLKNIRLPGSTEGSFDIEKKDGKRIVTYYRMQDTDWILVVEEPDTFIQESIKIIKRIIIQIALGIALLAFIITFLLSRSIYKPFGKLLKQVLGPVIKNDVKARLMDDVKLISDAFESNREKLRNYSYYKHSADHILMENYIKAVILENNSMANQLTGEFSSVYGNILEKGMMLILLKIDGLNYFEKLDSNSKKAYRFVIMNVSEEALDIGESARSIYIGEGEFIILVFLNEYSKGKSPTEVFGEKIRFVQQKLMELTRISVSAFIGGEARGAEELAEVFKLARQVSRYRLIFGREVILDPSTLENRESGNVNYNEAAEEKILEFIRSGNAAEAKTCFDSLIDLLSRGDIDDFIIYITQFSLKLFKTIDFLNKSRIEKITVSLKDINQKISSFESIEDLKSWFYMLLNNIMEKKVLVETRHDALVESIKKYVNENYMFDLSLKIIAAKFRLSSGYIGVVFKEYMGISVMDYVNNSRLEKAAELILQTELSIMDIMSRVGFQNESNFYKLFKKKYGATPKAYRIEREIIN